MRKFILDEEIDLMEKVDEKSTVDLLHAASYVETLTESVKNAPEGKAFNVGLFGEWGSGKSSIIRTFKKKIESETTANGKRVRVITYDAWKYANDSFRRMFLLQMQTELGFNRNELMNKFYLNSSEDAHIETQFSWKEFGIGVVALAFVYVGITKFTNFGTDGKILATAIVTLASLAYTILRGLMKEVKVNIQRPHLFAPEQFEECFNEMCDLAHQPEDTPVSYLKWIKGETGERRIERLVIVVDNVDRCSSDLAYELLTNIKNFLGCKHNTIFIVPVDEEALKRHFEIAKKKQGHEADEFLRKFFNICIRIKPYKRDEMYDFADALNKKWEQGYTPTTVSLVANEFAHNPRRIIQMFNNLSVELESLPKEYDDKHQALVCLTLIVREEYSVFYNIVQDDPEKLVKLDNLDADDKLKGEDGVKRFLRLNSAVLAPYHNNLSIVERILSNSPINERLSKNLKDEFEKMTYCEETKELLISVEGRIGLLHYVERKLKMAIKRQLWDTDVKNTIDSLIALNNAFNLTKDENLRFVGMITANTNFSDIAKRQPNLHQLIDYASYLEHQKITNVANHLARFIKEHGVENDEYKDSVEVWYASSLLSESNIKELEEIRLAACKKDINSPALYDYGSANTKTVFSDGLITYVLSKMESDEDSVVELMKHIASKKALSPSNLAAFVSALARVVPKYDYAQNNTSELRKRMEELNQVFEKCKDIRLEGDDVASVMEFYKPYTAETAVTSPNRYNASTEIRAYITDNLGKPETISVFLNFFKYASLITQDVVVNPVTIQTLLESHNYDNEIIDILTVLFQSGYSVEKYSKPLFYVNVVTDKLLSLLDYVLKAHDDKDVYVVADDDAKAVIERLLGTVKAVDEVKSEPIIKCVQSMAEDNRNGKQLEDILASKDQEWLLSLPSVLMRYAINAFERNIDEYKDQLNVMKLLASKGSIKAKRFVVGIANAKVNVPQERLEGIEIIKSFVGLSTKDAKPLLTSLEFIKENSPEESELVDECLESLNK